MSTPPVIYVDFNDTDEHRNVVGLRSRENARLDVAPGDVVELRDEDGFRVQGLVEKVTKETVVVAPDWGTWWNPGAVRRDPTPEPAEALLNVLLDAARTVGTETMADEKATAEKN